MILAWATFAGYARAARRRKTEQMQASSDLSLQGRCLCSADLSYLQEIAIFVFYVHLLLAAVVFAHEIEDLLFFRALAVRTHRIQVLCERGLMEYPRLPVLYS